jgi:hypothetical protein
MIASALVARLVATQVFGIDVRDAIEALRGTSSLAREKQTLTVTLTREGDSIRVSRKHVFDLVASGNVPHRLLVSLYTEIGSGGGFHSIVEPDKTELKGEVLAQYVTLVEGKAQFAKRYLVRPGDKYRFVIEASALFRRDDRLIWTVEHISSDFAVWIVDQRAGEGCCDVKINHHRRLEIDVEEHDTPSGREMNFDFLGTVLPFQGFELSWCDRDSAADLDDQAEIVLRDTRSAPISSRRKLADRITPSRAARDASVRGRETD